MHKELELKLVDQCKKGDRGAIQALVSHYERLVYNATYHLIGNQDDACDIAELVFLKAIRNIHQTDEKTNFSQWIYDIAVSESIKHRNRAGPGSASPTVNPSIGKSDNDLPDVQLGYQEPDTIDQLLRTYSNPGNHQLTLQKIVDQLARLPPQLPPLALHDQILQRVTPAPPHSFNLFRNRSINTITRFGYVLVISFMLGIGLYVFNPGIPPLQDAKGPAKTLVSNRANHTDSSVDQFHFTITDLSSQVILHEINDALIMDLSITSIIPVEIELDIISGNMEFNKLDLANGWRGHLTEGNQSVFLHNMGQKNLTLQLTESAKTMSRNHKTRIKVSYFIRGNRVQEHLLVNPN